MGTIHRNGPFCSRSNPLDIEVDCGVNIMEVVCECCTGCCEDGLCWGLNGTWLYCRGKEWLIHAATSKGEDGKMMTNTPASGRGYGPSYQLGSRGWFNYFVASFHERPSFIGGWQRHHTNERFVLLSMVPSPLLWENSGVWDNKFSGEEKRKFGRGGWVHSRTSHSETRWKTANRCGSSIKILHLCCWYIWCESQEEAVSFDPLNNCYTW